MTDNAPYDHMITFDDSEQLGQVVAALVGEIDTIGNGHRFEIWVDMRTLKLHDNGAECVNRILSEIRASKL